MQIIFFNFTLLPNRRTPRFLCAIWHFILENESTWLPTFKKSHPRFPMDLALTSTFRPHYLPEYSHSSRHLHRLFSLRQHPKLKPTLSRQTVIITVQKKAKIEGVSDEINSIASQNLDHVSARRRVRSAFVNVQEQLDHVLLKVWF